MLNDKLRHYLPCFSCGCVSVMSSVDLENAGPCKNLLGFACVNKGSYAVDISVKYVVLRVLVSAVDTFFSEHYCYVRSCYSGYVGVIVDWTAYFVFDDVQSLSLSSNLLSRYRNTADTLRGTFHKSVDVGLTHMSNNHDMVSAVPCSHSHSSDVVFKTSGSDLSSDYRHWLRVDAVKIFCRRKRYAVL